MICGIGVDIVQISAIEDSIRHYGESYLERMFTRKEIDYCSAVPTYAQRYAGRIAAKEAAMKALGTGWDAGVEWLDFEVTNEFSGTPKLTVYGVAAQMLQQKGISKMWVSLSHRPDYAIAQVIFERSWIRLLLWRLHHLYGNRTGVQISHY